MVTVPAFVWRGGFVSRALIVGGLIGILLGSLAWLDSGFPLSGVIVLVIVGTFYGVWMARRMDRYWPGAQQLDAADRVSVVRAARHGERVSDTRLSRAVVDYNSGLHAAAERGRPFRWVLPLVLVVSVGTAAWDAVNGSWGNAIASVIYLAALLVEMLWWPKRRDRLLSNGDRAAAL